mmetsp:Transcript_30496/g.81358  ORF Transcript_30496/g.81358 Transcript_30496/m.81358 type:complete len:271 (+) Transcript_30496:418-1230(+)
MELHGELFRRGDDGARYQSVLEAQQRRYPPHLLGRLLRLGFLGPLLLHHRRRHPVYRGLLLDDDYDGHARQPAPHDHHVQPEPDPLRLHGLLRRRHPGRRHAGPEGAAVPLLVGAGVSGHAVEPAGLVHPREHVPVRGPGQDQADDEGVQDDERRAGLRRDGHRLHGRQHRGAAQEQEHLLCRAVPVRGVVEPRPDDPRMHGHRHGLHLRDGGEQGVVHGRGVVGPDLLGHRVRRLPDVQPVPRLPGRRRLHHRQRLQAHFGQELGRGQV